MLALPILTLIKKLGMARVPRSLIRWIISDKNNKFFRYIEDQNKRRALVNIYLLKRYITDYLDEIPKKPNCSYLKNDIVSLPLHMDLGLLDSKKSPLGIS
jgi:hypothetical protein